MSEVQGRPAGTMSSDRRFAIAISVALILGGAYWALTNLTEDARTTHDSYALQGTALTVSNTSADLEVRSGDVREITVDRRFKRTVFGSDPKENYRDGKLEIGAGGCGFLSFRCETSYVLTVPKDVAVTIESTDGDIKLSDLPGGAKVDVTSGGVEAQAIGGELSVQTTSGDIEATALTATKVSGKTSSGKVDLTFTVAPSEVKAEASSGDVTVVLPEGTETYKIDTDTASGDESAEVRTDPAATRTVTATTSSGDVTVEYGRR
ncbi:hypothetical protein Kfla_1651 [Kribbella flavida DSM 17836]|uniref:DUF4097 domain-containing protein n=1 Tax=Kribbella flavida (strain DSM 17836 / JCM 10339 / NBRC 14399) TaxID=479435 RepID=D2PMK2_KRIFD|nr:DUF4097 family beta strand repeat-containing protein [Kribbella flavida]ADB30746.1 hypothetical protein Kfla_1651 [Kribbella flavida DSM 17836]